MAVSTQMKSLMISFRKDLTREQWCIQVVFKFAGYNGEYLWSLLLEVQFLLVWSSGQLRAPNFV